MTVEVKDQALCVCFNTFRQSYIRKQGQRCTASPVCKGVGKGGVAGNILSIGNGRNYVRINNRCILTMTRTYSLYTADITPYIQGVLTAEKYTISHEYREMETWDDFIMLSNRIHDDDLLVVIGARRTSISFSSDMEAMPTFLSRYFANHNIMIIYPEQFGAEAEMPTPIDPLSATITSNPSPLLLSVNRWRAQFSDYRKRRSSRRNRIDI